MAIIQGTENPDIINGTSESDEINALGGNDTIFGSAGNDTIDGGKSDTNVLDYSNTGKPITFSDASAFFRDPFNTRPTSFKVSNEELGTTQTYNIDELIGAENQPNTIKPGVRSDGNIYYIDLEEGNVNLIGPVSGVGGSFKVKNFVNIDFSGYDPFGNTQILLGSSASNSIIGGLKNDRIDGRDGNDTLTGSDGVGRGVGQQDTLTGGAGNDQFILGDSSGAYYKTKGNDDFANITDFGAGDLIQLGSGDTYSTTRTDTGFDLFVTTGGAHDLIANVQIANTGSGSNTNHVGIAGSGDALSALPEGDFCIAAGENLGGVFVGA
jgi:Ca2+-binding RTX toxin-like protein